MGKKSFFDYPLWIGTAFLGGVVAGWVFWGNPLETPDSLPSNSPIRVEDGNLCMGVLCENQVCGFEGKKRGLFFEDDGINLVRHDPRFKAPGAYLVVGGHEGRVDITCREQTHLSWTSLESGGLRPQAKDFTTIHTELENSGWVLVTRNTNGQGVEFYYQHNRYPERLVLAVWESDGRKEANIRLDIY